MSRSQRWYWLLQLGIVCGLSSRAGYGQCPSAFQIETQIDSIKRQAGGSPIRRLTEIRQQLLRNQCPHDSMFARITMQLGYARYVQGDIDSAIVLFKQSINLFQTPPARQSVRLVAAYFYLGQAYQAHTDDARAATAYLACIRLGGTSPEHDKMVGYALSGQALLCYKKGDYEAGLAYAGQAISQAQRCHDSQLEARCLNESARNLLYMGRYAQAITYIDRAAALVKADRSLLDDQNVYTLFRAQALVGLNQHGAALKLFTQLMTYYQRTDQPARLANVCGDVGDLYALKLHQPTRALPYYWRAYRSFADPYEKSRMLQSVGNILQDGGQYRASLSLLQQALQTLPIQFDGRNLRTNPSARSIRVVAHKVYLLTLVWDKADTWFDYAEATSDAAARRVLMKQALATYHVVDQMVDQMRWEQSGQQSKLYWRQQTRRLYEQALETCYQLNDTEQALHFFEKSRAVLLTDKLNELGASRGLPPALQAEEQALRRAVDGRVVALSQLQPGSTAYTTARAALMSEQDRADAFTQKLERINPPYYRYRYDNWVPALTDLYQYLGQRQAAFVSYFVGDSALYVLNVQAGKAQVNRHPLGRYQQTVREYLTLLGKPETLNRSFPAFQALSKQLYSQLLAPLRLSPGRVIVSPDGPFIPFETLLESPDRPSYALDQFAFSYAYSARFLLRTMQSPGTDGSTSDFLGVAPVRFASGLNQAPLPGSEAALRTIGDRFATPTLLLDKQATRRAFLDASASFRVVHLFTHALADSSGQEPRLFFADSTVSLSELGQGTLMNTQLVTLAACETGTGVEQRGEGVFSLARGFAALGVPAVLTTLWSVQNKSTYQITAQFYRYLADGLPKDIALQRARQDWLRTAEGTDQLPSAWAGLILVGNTEPLSAGGRRDWLGGLSGLLVGGLLQLGWRRWRRERTVSTRLLSE